MKIFVSLVRAGAATFSVALSSAALSSSIWAADLLSAYRDALAYDAQYAAARAALDAGREKIPQGRAGILPTIGLSANSTWNDAETTRRGAGTTPNAYNSNGWTVSLSQPVFRRQNWIAYTQAELAAAQAETQFNLARQDLVLRVFQAYTDVLLAQEALATAQAQKVAIAEQLESAKRNFEVGTSTITDTHEAQSRYDLVTAQEIAAQNDLTTKQFALRNLIGKDADRLKALKSGAQFGRPQPDDIAAWAGMAESTNLSVQSLQIAAEIAAQESERQRAGHYPTVDLVASHARNGQSYSSTFGSGIDSKSTAFGVQVNLPLFAGGATSSRSRETAALREKAGLDLENGRRSAALGARQAYLGLTSGLAQIKAYEAAQVSSQSALDANKLGYDVGVRINIDVLNAQSPLYDTRYKLTKARLDTLGALLKLKAAAGSLSENDLEALNTMLE
ncbi:MAG TPA: TolC family outer membrane protein [Rhodocyclaceae bacterium]|nr:TolC family outer membrane protein [Rhodocyclaceae bacterium]